MLHIMYICTGMCIPFDSCIEERLWQMMLSPPYHSPGSIDTVAVCPGPGSWPVLSWWAHGSTGSSVPVPCGASHRPHYHHW